MKRLTVWMAVFLLCVIAIALFLLVLGFRLNLTDSIPVGLYRIINTKPLKNSFVIFCPDDRLAFKQGLERGYIDNGLCPDGYGYLMKKVVAIQGDWVSITSAGVFVNQTLIPFSKPQSKDGMNRVLPRWQALNYQLKEDELITMTSQSEWSFDSRYYGPIPIGQIKGVITPIWVNTGEKA